MGKAVNPKKLMRERSNVFSILVKIEKYFHFLYAIKDSVLLQKNWDSNKGWCTLGIWHH